MKRCKKCGIEKSLDEFYAAKGMRDGYRSDCKDCNNAAKAARHKADPEPGRQRTREWQAANPDKVKAASERARTSGRKAVNSRRYHLKRKYGLTPEQYDEMLAAQGGVCAICGRPPRSDISLHVDHDHKTGAIRGLLHFSCNNALGDFEDDRQRLLNAASYLDQHDPETRELIALAKARVRALIAA